MKEQIKWLELDESEEDYLCKLIMTSNNEKPQDWNDSGFPSDDSIRRAQLQAIIRRLQGIVSSMSRMPTFRRRFRNLVKVLYLEAIESGALSSDGGSSKYRRKMGGSVGRGSKHDVEAGSRSEGNTIRSINSPNGPDEEMAGTNGVNRPERPFNGGDIVQDLIGMVTWELQSCCLGISQLNPMLSILYKLVISIQYPGMRCMYEIRTFHVTGPYVD